MKIEWIKLRYTTPDGETVKEIWAQTFVQGMPQIDRQMEDAIANIHMPRITCDLVERSETKPKNDS
jgi:hypothetical protein